MRDGLSDFLEAMMSEFAGGRAQLFLEFSALRECFAMIVDDRGMQDATVCVPHILTGAEQPLTWQELESGSSFRVDDPQMPEMLRRLRTVSSQMVSLRDETLVPQANQAAQRDIESLMVLKRLVEEDAAALRRKRDELRARVAELEEGVITQQLRLEVRRRPEEAQLTQETAQRRQEAEASLWETLAAMVAQDQQDRIAQDRRAAEKAAYAQLLAGVQAQFEAMQEQLQGQLNGWKNCLHGADYRFLAQSCVSLEGVVS